MQFWEENKADQGFDWPVAVVAYAFMAHYWAQPAEVRDGVLLERQLRGWLTAKDGLNAVWEAEQGPDSFEELFGQVRERARAGAPS